jgi:hypothetical protein
MSMKWLTLAAAVVPLSLAAAPADAHHSIQAVVDTSKVAKDEMVLTKIDWVNPHAWFHFTLTQADGSVVKDVQVEWMGIAGLRQMGYPSADAFKVGHTFMVSFNPNRDGTMGGHLVNMVDEATGQVYGNQRGGPPAPPAPPPPIPQLRGGLPPATKISY